uniref:(northern house mosquito) hypothetical protein n=1 Tax=Culex pipiens TaxID=7175 RepID=A0A8D8HPA4_CULPI
MRAVQRIFSFPPRKWWAVTTKCSPMTEVSKSVLCSRNGLWMRICEGLACTSLMYHVRLAAGREWAELQLPRTMSPARYRGRMPCIIGPCLGTSQTSKSPVTIMVWKEGASADTSQLYLPDEATFSPTNISWLSLEATRLTMTPATGNTFIAGFSFGVYR